MVLILFLKAMVMTIGELLADTQYGQKTILQKLIMYYCKLSREEMWLQSDVQIADTILQQIVSGYTKYVQEKMPLEYIVGKVSFLGYDFVVNEHTLIPRPETEYMIMAVNEYIELKAEGWKLSDVVLLDVGTGSGVLGLSVLLHNPGVFSHAILSEYSIDALEVAKTNYGLFVAGWKLQAESIDFVHGSLVEYLQNPDYRLQTTDKDIVLVANLPYIPDETFDTNVDETVKKWEPRMAFVWGDDGLDLYRQMFWQLFQLKAKGRKPKDLVMFLEMMTWQVEILREEFGDRMVFEEVKTFHFNIRIVRSYLL